MRIGRIETYSFSTPIGPVPPDSIGLRFSGCSPLKQNNAHKAHHFVLMRIGRIELPPHPWQGRVLPLNDIRDLFIFELYIQMLKNQIFVKKRAVFPLNLNCPDLISELC